MSAPLQRALCDRMPIDGTVSAIVVTSLHEFVAEMGNPKAVGFVDRATLAEVATLQDVQDLPRVVALCDEPLQTAITWLEHSWLSHVVSASMLDHPLARQHLENVIQTLTTDTSPRLLDWLEPEVTGRRVRLTHANKRVERLERMTDFLESKSVGRRTVQLIRDAAEELLTNAFYDAPVAAGVVTTPISRTQNVALTDDRACDLAYGCREDLTIVRVRDPFGSLTRRRLVEVLRRCARTDMTVEIDETMGGAGLGLWRVFSAASFVAISVLKNHHTEFLVGIAKKAPGQRPFAFHFFFREPEKRKSSRSHGLDAS